MRGYQASFASGEISPLLHGRIDLSKYATGLAKLENMIVLPQGGVTRRPGFMSSGGTLSGSDIRLIPFVYNSTDSAILEFGNKDLRIWSKSGTSSYQVRASLNTPYSSSELSGLRYVQSGNVIFLAHGSHKPQVLTRLSLTNWTLEDLAYREGPFIDGSEYAYRISLRLTGTTLRSIGGELFRSGMTGTLMRLEYAVEPKTLTLKSEKSPSESVSEWFEVKGTLNVTTSGDWLGTVKVDRSSDLGSTWVTVRQYVRHDIESQGQWEFTISETDENVIYRVRAQHEVQTKTSTTVYEISGTTTSESESVTPSSKEETADEKTNSKTDGEVYATLKRPASTKENPIELSISVSGYLKREVYRITSVISGETADVKLESETAEGGASRDVRVRLWGIGSWGGVQGYPKAVCMYQDRLVFGGTTLEPQSIWLSRTGDYASFGTSDPLRDDDAISLTLAGTSSDGIHSLLGGNSLLAFTRSGEWQVRGAGDNGAITPSAISAKEQTHIGSKDIQPVQTDGRIILVQAEGEKVYALGYDLNVDGYAGSELSIMSSHLFEGKEIVDMAYQQEPDSLLWFTLNDGTCAVCTYKPEHDVVGWSRQGNPSIKFERLASIPKEIFATGVKDKTRILMHARSRQDSKNYNDAGSEYESVMCTLRLTGSGDDGVNYAAKKLAARVTVYALNTTEAWCAPSNWEYRRRIRWDESDGLRESEIQLDNGFSTDACIQIRNAGDAPLTIAAISPMMTEGG